MKIGRKISGGKYHQSRKKKKWDSINQAIMLVAISELTYSTNLKDKIDKNQ